jgi:hypothetical protein
MYCPRCATQNLEGAKFCRACGTNLESVALALAADAPTIVRNPHQVATVQNALEKRSRAFGKIVKGVGLIGASLLVGTALGLFSHEPDWIVLWVVFGGWLGCWGVISLIAGLATFIEAKVLLPKAGETAKQIGTPTSPLEISKFGTQPELVDAPRHVSITEHTTRTLNHPHQ